MSKSSSNKWINLMNTLKWREISVWQDMNQQTLDENIPLVEEWTRMQLRYLGQHPQERLAFREFYWPSGKEKKSYNYILKDRAECALAALYAREQDNG